LNIDFLNLKMDGQYLDVDELNQTSNANIFAVGDIINKPNLTPVAIEQGMRFAIREGGRTIGAGVVSKILK